MFTASFACTGASEDDPRPTPPWGNDNDNADIIPPGETEENTIDTATGDAVIPTPDDLSLLRLTPLNTLIELDLDTPHTLDFTAMAEWSNGTSQEVTSEVAWSVSNPAVGTFNGSTLQVPGFADTAVVVGTVDASIVKNGNTYTGHAQITIAAYRQSGDELDFFFVLPYDDGFSDNPDAQPKTAPLAFSTDVKALDVFLAMDTTGSMGEEIKNLQLALGDTVITDIQAQVTDTQFGVGAIEDFPVESPDEDLAYGDSECEATDEADQPFDLLQRITGDVPEVQAAVNALANDDGDPIGCGYDLPESIIEGLYQIATGEGLDGPGVTKVPAQAVGFRATAGAMPVIVPITDAMSHAPGEMDCGDWEQISYKAPVEGVAHTRDEALDALDDICARVVTIASVPVDDSGVEVNPDELCSPVTDGNAHATATGARVPPSIWGDAASRPIGCAADKCCTGINGTGVDTDAEVLCPLVFRVSMEGEGLSDSIVTGLSMLTLFARFDVQVELTGENTSIDGVPLPAGKSSADFISSITPTSWENQPLPDEAPPTKTDTTFLNVMPGTTVKFDVTAHNDWLLQTEKAQIFEATIRVSAGHCIDLDELDVRILVPPKAITPE
ncbi:MAG: hypothetical protein V3V08_14445 [Nannocystaceae bacterium]